MSQLAVSPQEPIRRRRPTPQQKRNVRECYVTGQHSLSVCAQKHGVSEHTAYNWSDQEDWGDLRRAFDYQEQERLLSRTKPAEPTPQPTITYPKGSQQDKLLAIETQLEQLDTALKECDEKSYASLWKAKSLALDAWALLTGFPRPGVRRPSKNRPTLTDVSPLGLSSAPDTPSPSVQPSQDQSQIPQSTQSPDWKQFTG